MISEIFAPTLAGQGSPDLDLSNAELSEIVAQALQNIEPGERVLAIIPDKTRDNNTDILFPIAAEFLARKNVAQFDALVAQGTHPPMTEAQKRAKIGAGNAGIPGLDRIFDHQWDRSDQLVTLGELNADQVRELTGGLIEEAVDVRLNALLGPGIYDTVLVFGATMPHEVAGFAGGAKYFFPGVAGPELTHLTHWLGGLAPIAYAIGRIESPTRRRIQSAAEPAPSR